MALKNLYALEMLPLSTVWLDAQSKANAAILKFPELAISIPHLTIAHSTLSLVSQPAVTPRLEAIQKEEAELDVRHDAIIRAIWGALTYMAELVGGDEATVLLALRDTLIPDGLTSQNKTYRGEAGQAEQLALRMTPVVRKDTDSISIGKAPNAKPLTAYVDELIDIGSQLGKLEDERGQLEDETPGADRQKARRGWVNVAKALMANARLADIDEDTDRLLFGPLREAETRADARARDAAKARAAAKAAKNAKGAAQPGAPGTATAPEAGKSGP